MPVVRITLPSGAVVAFDATDLERAVDSDAAHDEMDYAAAAGAASKLSLAAFRKGLAAAVEAAVEARDAAVAQQGASDFESLQVTFGVDFMLGADIKVANAQGAGSMQLAITWKGNG